MPVSVKVWLLRVDASVDHTGKLSGTLRLAVSTMGKEVIFDTTINELINEGVTKFFPELKKSLKTSHKRLKHASMQQEQKSAEALGGRRQSGSGARPGNKGDGRVRGRFRIENKFTTAESFRVKLAELRKLRAECEGLEVPIFDVQFKEKVTLRTIDNWVLVPRDHWEKLANAQAGND